MSVREMEGTGVGDRAGLSTIPPTNADSRQGTYSVATSTRSAAVQLAAVGVLLVGAGVAATYLLARRADARRGALEL